MTYEIIDDYGRKNKIEDVDRIINGDEEFTFFDKQNRQVFIITKLSCVSIKLITY